jgi:hypothetical protein
MIIRVAVIRRIILHGAGPNPWDDNDALTNQQLSGMMKQDGPS